MIRRFALAVLTLFYFQVSAQHTLTVLTKDSATHSPLIGVTAFIQSNKKGGASDVNGRISLSDIPDGDQQITFNYIGYKSKIIYLHFPIAQAELAIFLSAEKAELEEVIVSSTRTNSRIDDLPIKVEVLGQEDMDEESTIVPNGVGSILGDLSVITIQRTNPINGNDAVRLQGLDYKYTQMLRDGLPLYEGFSGSLGVLSIPPLDLKQVEIIKGSASTLYGGGAIGGLINFISKTPIDSPAVTLTLNQTSLKESNINLFLSRKRNKTGATLFAGGTLKQVFDVNGDGFAEIPQQQNFIFHPRVFFYISPKANADAGLTITSDNRRGGDIYAVQHTNDSVHPFLFTEKIIRGTLDAHATYQLNEKNSLTLKTTSSLFDRSLYYAGFNFEGSQLSSYSEINNVYKNDKHIWVTGINATTEVFKNQKGDSIHFGNYDYVTLGGFSQEDWLLFKKLSLEAGIRGDYHDRYKWFMLPAAGIFYKPTTNLSLRLHYGTGYKTPNLFTGSQAQDYAHLIPVSDKVKPELSTGVNMDINYHILLFNTLSVQLNQALYYTTISNPTIIRSDSLQNKFITNGNYDVTSIGTDTYLRLKLDDWELYVGYNHTEAKQNGTGVSFNMPFNPKDKFATTLTYEIEHKWRMGIESSYFANQYIYNNIHVPDYWFVAGMLERKIKFGSIVLNCENIGD